MAERGFSAHPILEPADYGLTPKDAAAVMSGGMLEAYTLLWHAAVATLQDGPVFDRESLLLDFEQPMDTAYGRCTAIFRYDTKLSDGWAVGDLAPELARFATPGASVLPQALLAALARVETTLVDGGWRLRSPQKLADVTANMPAPATYVLYVAEVRLPKLSLGALIEQMAEYGVGRPSTYAGRVTRSMETDLVRSKTDGLEVGVRGLELLKASEVLNSPAGQFSWAESSSQLERDLFDVESGQAAAGDVLNRHAQNCLQMSPALASWLDNLQIEGETLKEALQRVTDRLPQAQAWDGEQPVGLRPAALVADYGAAQSLREDLDRTLSGSDPQAWRAATPRIRAACRLAALYLIKGMDTPTELKRMLVLGNRDIAYRWWIDLGPGANGLVKGEVEVAVSYLRGAGVSVPSKDFLLAVLKALG